MLKNFFVSILWTNQVYKLLETWNFKLLGGYEYDLLFSAKSSSKVLLADGGWKFFQEGDPDPWQGSIF